MTELLPAHRPALYLAPMQDVTDLTFMRVLAGYGGADVYVTEYFRVHAASSEHDHNAPCPKAPAKNRKILRFDGGGGPARGVKVLPHCSKIH